MYKFKELPAAALAVVLTLGGFMGTALAHHSFAMYDASKVRVFTGVVVRVNPDSNHMQIYFAPLNTERTQVLRDKADRPVIWMVEVGGAAQEAQKNNVSVNSFPPGTVFSIGLSPLRNGQPGGARGALGLFKCPPKTPPAPGMHCDSVKGATAHGPGVLPKEDGPAVADKPGQ